MEVQCALKECTNYGNVVHNVVCPRCKTVPRVLDED